MGGRWLGKTGAKATETLRLRLEGRLMTLLELVGEGSAARGAKRVLREWARCDAPLADGGLCGEFGEGVDLEDGTVRCYIHRR